MEVKKKMNKTNGKTVVVKKYGNRRLYDVTNSVYINQDEVGVMVQKGYNVQVVDATTGEDLTRLVLTQIIVQHAKDSESAFPLDILRQMVVACGKATRDNTLKYTKALLDMYQNAYQAVAPSLNPFEFMQASPARPATPPMPGVAHTEASSEVKTAHGKKEDTAEVSELKRRLEELESRVSRYGSRKTKRRRKEKPRRPRG
jgi:polyhydroxyalkanoate synthesis repressor PhaR